MKNINGVQCSLQINKILYKKIKILKFSEANVMFHNTFQYIFFFW